MPIRVIRGKKIRMAFRIHDSVVRGEIDNRVKGIVRGKIWVEGRAEPVVLELKGNAWPDLAGCLLTFTNPHKARSRISISDSLHPDPARHDWRPDGVAQGARVRHSDAGSLPDVQARRETAGAHGQLPLPRMVQRGQRAGGH